MLVSCWWHPRFFPTEEVPELIILGNDGEERNAICPKCRRRVVEEVKKEEDNGKVGANA